jgi:transcriptional regulator with XRE-family HTH domain
LTSRRDQPRRRGEGCSISTQVERRFQFDDIALHERLKICRRRRGLTQKVAAERIGRSERWMVDVEAGRVDLRISDIADLADIYSVAPELLTADQFDIDASRVSSEARSGRISPRARTVAPQGTLIVESDDAELRYENGLYRVRMRRHLLNGGETPVTRVDVRINVDRYPGDPERSNQLYRANPLAWEELQFRAACDREPMLWTVKDDRDAVKELCLRFESPQGRGFPLYPGEATFIEYSYSVGDDKWGPWFQRHVRWPTRRLSVQLLLPAACDPLVWGTEASVMAERIPLGTPISRRQESRQAVFEWSTDNPLLHTRYRFEWSFRRGGTGD